jgi:hypothetical protein
MDQNGKPNGIDTARTLAGEKPAKVHQEKQFAVSSLGDVLSEIRRAGGTGKLEINFKNGHARGEAKWRGFSREEP